MIKNFHWGHGITIFYIVFVGVVVTALIASFGVDHTLVVDDYYAQDLTYQERFDKIENSLQSGRVELEIKGDNIHIQFPDSDKIDGSIQFYRASDKSMDFTHTIVSNSEIISFADKASGKWSVKMDWQSEGKSYYKEKVIYL